MDVLLQKQEEMRQRQEKKQHKEHKKRAKFKKSWKLVYPFEGGLKLARRESKYGMKLGSLEILWEKQNRRCAICKKIILLEAKTTHVDHDHKTQQVRGLLCQKCNSGIGYFRDDPYFMVQAAEYILSAKKLYIKKFVDEEESEEITLQRSI